MTLSIPPVPMPRGQRGISLLIVLILLLVTTLLGVVVLRGTLLEERMSANMYDRSLAFQAAESALRNAELAVQNAVDDGVAIGFDCSLPGTACPVVPPNAYTDNIAGCEPRTQDCWINDTATEQALQDPDAPPQYYIQYMGQRDSIDELNLGSSANANQYGGGGGVPIESVYRVIARSHDPSSSQSARSVVVLQSNIAVK